MGQDLETVVMIGFLIAMMGASPRRADADTLSTLCSFSRGARLLSGLHASRAQGSLS
jgi:hypothetical protein